MINGLYARVHINAWIKNAGHLLAILPLTVPLIMFAMRTSVSKLIQTIPVEDIVMPNTNVTYFISVKTPNVNGSDHQSQKKLFFNYHFMSYINHFFSLFNLIRYDRKINLTKSRLFVFDMFSIYFYYS